MPQSDTHDVTAEQILRSAEFQRGVADMRAGRSPRFDNKAGDVFCYEWGRQFAAVAPRNLPLMIGRAANPKAVALLECCFNNGALNG